MNALLNYILGGKDDESKPSIIKEFIKDPDNHKILIETIGDEVVIRIRRKTNANNRDVN